MASEQVFQFTSYKAFLEAKVGPREERRGIKSQIAQVLGCQPTYISQVLHGKAHLSLEQADRLNSYLGHSKEESAFFLLLVQHERAGTVSLRRHFQDLIDEELKRRLIVTHRLGEQTKLSLADQSRYYSSWHYSALHIALTIPELGSPDALAQHFKLPMKKVNEVLRFLLNVGLAKEVGGRLLTGPAIIRLGNDSPNIQRHHANWRQQATESLDREDLGDLHYSGVISLSEKDALKIKDRLLDELKANLKIVRDSPEEKLFGFCVDFFDMAK